MSRIGKAPIAIPKGVDVKVDEKTNTVTVKGPKGQLTQTVNPDLHVAVEDGHVVVTRPSDDREHRAQHGLFRALIHNMVVGVSEGYRKEMELPIEDMKRFLDGILHIYDEGRTKVSMGELFGIVSAAEERLAEKKKSVAP